ncbi:MAG: AAA family ATPase [Candidatus Omnitrophica bacterium]|nr:AAA family ATPase [Candidatus Omnitrophota bacterium]
MLKKIFIAATLQNEGKTTVSLGLIRALRKRFRRIGFIKPIGQRYLQEQGYKVDEDSVLIEKVCNVECLLKDMSPVAIEKGFTERYIDKPDKKALVSKIKASFKGVSQGKDLVVIEGTGHAGVGSCFDLSNADVAHLLGSKVILISSGGIGRPIDEIMLNVALFKQKGVGVLGVIINKVKKDKYKKIKRYVEKGFKRQGIDVLGVLPYIKTLTNTTIKEIMDETGFKLLCGKANVNNKVAKVLIGAMEPRDALNFIEDDSLLITPGDREDMVLTATSINAVKGAGHPKIAGLVLTGGFLPHDMIMNLAAKSGIPVLYAKNDTYSVASKIHDLTIKIRPQDEEKTRLVEELIEEYVDIDRLIKKL